MIALALLAFISASPAAEAVESAVRASARLASLDVISMKQDLRVPPGCRITHAAPTRDITGTGRVSVALDGENAHRACHGWAWVDVQLRGSICTTTANVASGEPLASALHREEKSLRAGEQACPAGVEQSVAGRALKRGVIIRARDVRPAGPVAGQSVDVVLHSGGVTLTQTGRTVTCGRGRTCAEFPSGRRVDGTWSAGRLMVEVP